MLEVASLQHCREVGFANEDVLRTVRAVARKASHRRDVRISPVLLLRYRSKHGRLRQMAASWKWWQILIGVIRKALNVGADKGMWPEQGHQPTSSSDGKPHDLGSNDLPR